MHAALCPKHAFFLNYFGALLRAKATHQRNIMNPLGRTEFPFVATGNKIASRVALLIWYSIGKCCRFLLEQPRGSAAELHPRLVELWCNFAIMKVGIWGGAYADSKADATPKRHWLYSNDEQLVRRLCLASGVLTKEELAQFGGSPTMKKERRGPYEKETYTGVKKNLEASGTFGSIGCSWQM